MTLNQPTESESWPSNEHSESTTSKYIQLKYERWVITEEHLRPMLHVNDYRLPCRVTCCRLSPLSHLAASSKWADSTLLYYKFT